MPDYLTTANDQICLILQIESRAGLAALDDILAMPGIDGVFIGPSDLAADMGHLGNAGHPEVRAAVLDALRRIARLGQGGGGPVDRGRLHCRLSEGRGRGSWAWGSTFWPMSARCGRGRRRSFLADASSCDFVFSSGR